MEVTLLQSSPPENTRDSTRVFVISGFNALFYIARTAIFIARTTCQELVISLCRMC